MTLQCFILCFAKSYLYYLIVINSKQCPESKRNFSTRSKDDDIVDAKMMMGWLQTKQRVQHEQEAGVALPELMSNNSNPLLLIMIMMFLTYMITMTMQEIRMRDIFERDPQRERGGQCDVALCLNCILH